MSVADAQRLARERAAEIVRKAANREPLDQYWYGERPLREPIIDEITNREGERIGLVTRNAYGALVLNTATAMFIDVDFERPQGFRSLVRSFRRLLGKHVPGEEARHLQHLEAWASGRPDWSLRVYRTFGGLRCLVTDRLFEPTQEETLEFLRSAGSDPLYIRLCRSQECFRARLTPKPWRCGVAKPPNRYPWENREAEALFRGWEAKYTQATSQYAVCRLVRELGRGRVYPEVAPILATHDRYCCAGDGQRLA